MCNCLARQTRCIQHTLVGAIHLRTGIPLSRREQHAGPGRRCLAVHAVTNSEACRLLGVSQDCSRAELRIAYLQRIRQLHPDVNQLRDTTDEAAALNEAYETLQAALHISGNALLGDVFDAPEGPATELFVNPFACSASPLMWRELQEVVKGAGEEPEQALAAAGVAAGGSAVCYLTREQLAVVVADLEAMEETLSVELTSWFVTDCLLRAARANARMPVPRRG